MNKKLIMILVLFGIIIPVNAHALSGSTTITCDKTILNSNETANCSVKANVQGQVSAVHSKIVVGSNLTLVSVTPDSIWQGDGENGVIDLYTDVNKTGNFNIASFVVKAGDVTNVDTNVSLTEVILSDEAFNEVTLGNSSVKLRIASSINTLSSLTVSGATFDFNPATLTYNVTVNSASTVIGYTASDTKAGVTGYGTKTLNYGVNKFDIVVTAENGARKTYTLNITRPDNRSADNNLSSLTVSGATFDFSPSTLTYNLTVNNASTVISYTASDTKAGVTGYGTKTLNYGANKFDIVVTAENGAKKTYTLNITRPDGRSGNNDLNILTISQGQLVFNKDITDYSVTVPFEVAEVALNAQLADEKAKVEGLGIVNLQVGSNPLVVKVTAENGAVKEYKIVVTREQEVVVTSSNLLKTLVVEGHEIGFNPSVNDYRVVTDSTSLNIYAEVESANASYQIIGNEALQNGSVVQVVVSDSDGNSNIYRITVENNSEVIDDTKAENDDINIIPYIMIGLLLILIVLNFTVFKKCRKVNS